MITLPPSTVIDPEASSVRSRKTLPAALKAAIYIALHLEGGIVREVLVADGDRVVPGDLLVRFDSAASGSDLNQLETRHLLLDAKAMQLRA